MFMFIKTGQRRDVPESYITNVRRSRRWKFQRRDIRIQRRDVPESHLSQRRDVEI